jgi:hypothetical protein
VLVIRGDVARQLRLLYCFEGNDTEDAFVRAVDVLSALRAQCAAHQARRGAARTLGEFAVDTCGLPPVRRAN